MLQIDGRHFALLAAFDIEAHLLAFAKVTESGNLDGRDVNEDIFRSVFRLNEAVTCRFCLKAPDPGTWTIKVRKLRM